MAFRSEYGPEANLQKVRQGVLPEVPVKEVEKLDEEHVKYYTDMGYGMPVKLDGEIVALGPFLYTVGIVVGMDETGYKHRFCYPSQGEAMIALLAWIGSDDEEPPGYIKKKG